MAQPRDRGSSSTSSTEHPDARRLRIGRVGRPHGLRGLFEVLEPTLRAHLLEVGKEIRVGDVDLRIVTRQGADKRPVIGVEGVTDRASAESMRGLEITIPRAALGELERDEYLVDDLIGLEVTDEGRLLGSVADVLLLPAADVLEVRRPDGTTLLVPLVRDAVRAIDVKRRRIDIDGRFLGEAS